MTATKEQSRISTTLYFNANTSKGDFPGQIVVESDNAESYGELFTAVITELVKEPAEDDLISYTPRPISSPASGGGNRGGGNVVTATKTAPQPDENAPICPIHGRPRRLVPAGVSKNGKRYGAFYGGCPEKDAQGNYCSYRDPK